MGEISGRALKALKVYCVLCSKNNSIAFKMKKMKLSPFLLLLGVTFKLKQSLLRVFYKSLVYLHVLTEMRLLPATMCIYVAGTKIVYACMYKCIIHQR